MWIVCSVIAPVGGYAFESRGSGALLHPRAWGGVIMERMSQFPAAAYAGLRDLGLLSWCIDKKQALIGRRDFSPLPQNKTSASMKGMTELLLQKKNKSQCESQGAAGSVSVHPSAD